MIFPLAPFADQRFINLETYKKSGQAMPTPVWFVEYQDSLYVITTTATGKVKRVRNNPRVRIAPCDARGNLKGAWVDAQARIGNAQETARTIQMIDHKYGWQKKLVYLIRSFRPATDIALVITVDTV